MKFRVQSSDLKSALSKLSAVTPMPVSDKSPSGYLFEIKGGKCSIHSRAEIMRIRVDLPLAGEVEEEGCFVYPYNKVGALNFLEGWVDFEFGQEEDRFWVKYTSEEGCSVDRTSLDPDFFQALSDEELGSGEGFEVSAPLLKESLAVTSKFTLRDPEKVKIHGAQYETVQLFDASAKKEWAGGDGCMFASDHVRMIYFVCSAFKGKHVSVHNKVLPSLQSFLSKCDGNVKIHNNEYSTFVSSGDSVFGWSLLTKYHGKYGYYPFSSDHFVFQVPKALILKALKYTKAEMGGSARDRVRVSYNHAEKTLRFLASDEVGSSVSGLPVGVELVKDPDKGGMSGDSEDFATNVNVSHMIDLVESVKGHQVELRFASINNGKAYAIRTIERFLLDSNGKVQISKEESKEETFSCEITRFMPSRN